MQNFIQNICLILKTIKVKVIQNKTSQRNFLCLEELEKTTECEIVSWIRFWRRNTASIKTNKSN